MYKLFTYYYTFLCTTIDPPRVTCIRPEHVQLNGRIVVACQAAFNPPPTTIFWNFAINNTPYKIHLGNKVGEFATEKKERIVYLYSFYT